MRFLTLEERCCISLALRRWYTHPLNKEKSLSYALIEEIDNNHVLVGSEDSCNAALKFVNTVEKELNERK